MDGWVGVLIEVISHTEIKDKYQGMKACLYIIIIFGDSQGIPSESGVIPGIKSSYRTTLLHGAKAHLMTS